MKKIIFTLLVLLPLLTMAQSKIIIDKVDSDGTRTIATKCTLMRNGFTDKCPLKFGLVAFVFADGKHTTDLCLELDRLSPLAIPKDGVLLIKLDNDEILELHQALPTLETKDIVGTYVKAAGMTTYTTHAMYPLTDAQLQLIHSKLITKIRLETETKTFDQVYKPKRQQKLYQILSAQCEEVSKRLAEKKDIRSGF